MTLGINCTELALLSPGDAVETMIDIADFGFRHVRVEIPMALVAPKAGQWNWGATTYRGNPAAGVQLVADTARELGLELLPILGVHMPSWKWKPKFGEFCERAHAVLGSEAYEIMNETNVAIFSEGNWAKASYLAGTLKAARLALPPSTLVVSGGMAAAVTYTGWAPKLGAGPFGIPWLVHFHNESPEMYLSQVISQGGQFDIAGYHPYSLKDDFQHNDMPSATQPMIVRCKTIRDLVKRPVWATEWGFDATNLSPAEIDKRYRIQLPLVAAQCERQYLFCWRDFAGKFGLVDANDVPRQPVYDTIKEALQS